MYTLVSEEETETIDYLVDCVSERMNKLGEHAVGASVEPCDQFHNTIGSISNNTKIM